MMLCAQGLVRNHTTTAKISLCHGGWLVFQFISPVYLPFHSILYCTTCSTRYNVHCTFRYAMKMRFLMVIYSSVQRRSISIDWSSGDRSFFCLFTREGDIEYTGCGNTEHRGCVYCLIAILPRLAWEKVRGSMFCTILYISNDNGQLMGVFLYQCLKISLGHSNRWTQCNHHKQSSGLCSSWEGRETPFCFSSTIVFSVVQYHIDLGWFKNKALDFLLWKICKFA